MKKLSRFSILKDIVFLFVAFILTVLFSKLVLGIFVANTGLDIKYHDTVMPSIPLVEIFAVGFTFIVFSIREMRLSFFRKAANAVIIFAGLVLLFIMFLISIQTAKVEILELSIRSLAEAPPQSGQQFYHFPIGVFTLTFGLLQMMIVICLLMICYNWGKRAQQPTSALRQLGEGISPIS
jgi:hypothetical protein